MPESDAARAPAGKSDDRLLLLSPEDNVLVSRVDLGPGDRLEIDGVEVCLAEEIPVGFKVARRAIEPGEKILKYGAPIGSATARIAPGDIVHLDNMKSDYLPTYTLDGHAQYTRTGAK